MSSHEWRHVPNVAPDLRDRPRSGTRALLSLLAVPLLLGAWAWSALLRLTPRRSDPGWHERRTGTAATSGPGLGRIDARPRPRPRRERLAIAAILLATVLATPAGRDLATRLRPGQPPAPDQPFLVGQEPADAQLGADGLAIPLADMKHPVPFELAENPHVEGTTFAAHEGIAWYEEEDPKSAGGYMFDPAIAFRTINPHRVLDLRSKYINVEDGHRRSWQPPPCDCRPIRVWVYGGSTTFGLDQRDEHTIPSYLAKAAHEAGLTVEVDNRGLMGHTHWMEAEHFALDLTEEPAPDLVIFYDGVNDGWEAHEAAMSGAWESKRIFDPTSSTAWAATGRSDGPLPDAPPGASFRAPTSPDVEDPRATSREMMRRFDRARMLSRAIAAEHGLEPHYFWQPSRISRDLVPSEPHFDGGRENWNRAIDQYQASLLADDVTDLTDVLDPYDEPMFSDDVHHNELGARIIADAIYASIEDELLAIARERGRR
jgi:lysophospholipase L1-like esterase